MKKSRRYWVSALLSLLLFSTLDRHQHMAVVSVQGAETLLSFLFFFSAELEADPLSQARYRWYGYIAAYIACIFGHRPGLLSNMRVKEVLAAKDKAD